MSNSKECSICTEKLSYKRELQNFNCKNCIQSDDRLICKSCLVNLSVCPFCRGSKCNEVRIDIHRTTLGVVNNLIVVKRKKCCDKLFDKLFRTNNIILHVEEEESEMSICECIRRLNLKNIFISIWVACVLYTFGYYACNKNNHNCKVCIIAGILTPVCFLSYILKLLSDLDSKVNCIFSFIWSLLFTILILMVFGISEYCNFNLKILYMGIFIFILFFCCSINTSITCCH